jgi:hypothetical protein
MMSALNKIPRTGEQTADVEQVGVRDSRIADLHIQ